ncbi:MAG: hypothetical protein KKD31_13640, partial [Bacteroidetes bacterium]|nr:hypothetical protein [Bacteroidota bacterium]
LVAINISDPLHPTELSRIHGVYDYKHQMYPEAGGWFECVDTTRGLVVDWEPASLTNPKCFRE